MDRRNGLHGFDPVIMSSLLPEENLLGEQLEQPFLRDWPPVATGEMTGTFTRGQKWRILKDSPHARQIKRIAGFT